ncbi:tRNA-dihydrouridine(16) synthase [bioreactor metagenome]|uniref:tRNA-dihydrouridine(16) synthase n=1 Tax=bioreactor metagenome TaxID=1076179 RepID=A0A645DFA4_9ZZZZ
MPQLLTNNAADFTHTADKIKLLGYGEVNLNLGCPSGTVVAKYRGSGFLAKKEELNLFLEEIFAHATTKISIKARIGKDEPEEFYKLIEIFNQYPIEELIIHPRLQRDFYNNKPNLQVFEDALKLSKNPVCYNGDIFTVQDYNALRTKFPSVETYMLGRGLLRNPGLIGEISQGAGVEKSLLKNFHDSVYHAYQKEYYGEKNVLYKMKEIWFYLISSFADSEKYLKKIKKCERLSDYDIVVSALFSERELVKTGSPLQQTTLV